MTTNTLKTMYEEHHRSRQRDGFSVFEKERGEVLSQTIGSGKQVLDIGCRDGTLTQHFSKHNEVLGVDIDERLLEKARRDLGIKTESFDLNGDWGELGGRRFDVVVAGEILEHLYYPNKVIQRARAALKENGMFIGSVPNAFSIKNRIRLFLGNKRNTPLADPTHINHFSVSELSAMLRLHFSSVQIIGLGKYRKLARWLPGLFAFDLIFIASL
ncbi:MAG: hypothetical protein AMXMBFR44_1160 [Candidatus Campbellbacteria bacterium]